MPRWASRFWYATRVEVVTIVDPRSIGTRSDSR
jgi:hypothetical protein